MTDWRKGLLKQVVVAVLEYITDRIKNNQYKEKYIMKKQVVEASMGIKSLNILYNSAINGVVGGGYHGSMMAKE